LQFAYGGGEGAKWHGAARQNVGWKKGGKVDLVTKGGPLGNPYHGTRGGMDERLDAGKESFVTGKDRWGSEEGK